MSDKNLNISDLSAEERQVLATILSEYGSLGYSDTMLDLIEDDFDDIPVDMYTFITDPEYLGSALTNDEGKLLIYDYWVDMLKESYPVDSKGLAKYSEVALSGAIGIGKSTIAIIGLCYTLHYLLCLKNPAKYYNLTKGSKICIALFNISVEQGYRVGYSKMQGYLRNSPWFLARGKMLGREHPTYYPGKDIIITVGSKPEHFIGLDVFAALLDEMEFAKGADAKMELSGIMKVYTAVKRRIESRFMKMGKIPGTMFLVSSKKSAADFLEQYIKLNSGKPTFKVVDEPVWVVKQGLGLYSGETFAVAVGNNYVQSKILEPNEDRSVYEKSGQEVVDVPVEYRDAFELDINTSLMDIAGKALSSNLKYIYYDKLKNCYRSYIKNPFTRNYILLDFDDDTEIKDFIDFSILPKLGREKPHFIHWDTSKTGDRTGLSMGTVVGTKEVRKLRGGEMFQEEDIIHRIIFSLRIGPTPGKEIPFYKIRRFIYYLKFELGFNIISVTSDSYQSVDTLQQMKLKGFLTDTLSVDRSIAPYTSMKNAINEERLLLPNIDYLEDEILDLEHDKVRNKVDHPADGSKDISDSVCGVIYRSINYKKLLEDYQSIADTEILVESNEVSSNTDYGWLLDEDIIAIYD